MKVANALLLAVAWLVPAACGGSSSSSSYDSGSAGDAYGAAFQGNGIECGAIICAVGQQCCLVYVPHDASGTSGMGMSHACDEGCESVCADTCPDAGGMTQSFPPSGTSMPSGGMPPMGGAAPGAAGGPPASGEGGAPTTPGMGGPTAAEPGEDAGMGPPMGGLAADAMMSPPAGGPGALSSDAAPHP